MFRRLLVRCGVQPGTTGNAVSLDDTSFVCVTTSDNANVILHDEESSPFEEQQLYASAHDHDYMSPFLNSLVENVVVYIAGWVVRKAMKSLPCDDCRAGLVTVEIPNEFRSSFQLLQLKNNGGLVIPSAGCVKVIRIAEKTVRQSLNLHRATNKITSEHLVSHVLAVIGAQDIFELGEHINDTQDGVDNHHYKLLRVLLSSFLTLRQYHIAKLHTLRLQKNNVRQVTVQVYWSTRFSVKYYSYIYSYFSQF